MTHTIKTKEEIRPEAKTVVELLSKHGVHKRYSKIYGQPLEKVQVTKISPGKKQKPGEKLTQDEVNLMLLKTSKISPLEKGLYHLRIKDKNTKTLFSMLFYNNGTTYLSLTHKENQDNEN